MAKPLIQLHSVAFRCISYRLRGGWAARFPSARERRGNSGVRRSGETFISPLIFRSFPVIPLVDWGWGCEVPAFAGTTGVGGATAGSGLSRWDGDRLRWCTLATPGIGPGRSRPRHACRNLGGVCKWVTHVGGTEPDPLLQHWNHRTRSQAYLQLSVVALMSFAVRSVRGRGVVGDGAGMRGSRLRGGDGGVAKSGETFNSVPFGSISFHSFPNPHPCPLPEGEGVSAFA